MVKKRIFQSNINNETHAEDDMCDDGFDISWKDVQERKKSWFGFVCETGQKMIDIRLHKFRRKYFNKIIVGFKKSDEAKLLYCKYLNVTTLVSYY